MNNPTTTTESQLESLRRTSMGGDSAVRAILQTINRHPFERIGVVLAVVAVGMAVFGPVLAPHDPYAVDFAGRLRPPSLDHPLGTDAIGRDVFSRILHGARLTLTAVVVVIAFATVVGVLIGTTAALGNSLTDEALMRATDIGLSLPALVLALGIAAALGKGLTAAIVALAVAWWPGYARLVRSLVLQTRDKEFVEAARSLGASRGRLVFRHILPNSLDTLFIQMTESVAAVTLTLAGLSFIGVGALPPEAEWGAMIADGRAYTFSAWWVVVFPGLAISLTAVGFILVGDLLRSALDPAIRPREPYSAGLTGEDVVTQ